MPETFDRSEFMSGYLAEVEEHLESAKAELMKLDQAVKRNEPQYRMVRELFRALHTIKGLSAMVGVEPIVALAHEVEELLRVRGEKSAAISAAGVELLFRSLRAVEARLRAVGQNQTVEPAPPDLLDALHALQSSATELRDDAVSGLDLAPELVAKLPVPEREQLVHGLANGLHAFRLDFAPSPQRAEAGVTITSMREAVGRSGEIVKVLPRSVAKTASAPSGLSFAILLLTKLTRDQLLAALGIPELELTAVGLLGPAPEVATPATPSEPAPIAELDHEIDSQALSQDTIRVEVTRLDDALEKLGALVVTRYRLERELAELKQQGVDVRAAQAILTEHARELRRLRGSLTHARMVPMKQLLERVPLLVRGIARETGKQVQLHIDAGRAELDKAVAERVFPALVHLVRNAVDHAIEPAPTRKRLGKPEAGTITIRCFETGGNQLELSVSDDGAGIDRERVARKASAPLPEDDRALLELITRPGLSTLDAATQRSGRGMGMDIVRRVAVEMLGGELKLVTARDVGTTFTLRLPTSISIIDSFAFRCAEQSFVVPLSMVDEIVELEADKVIGPPVVRGRARALRVLRRRGENIPLFELSSLFALSSPSSQNRALIARRDGERYAFAIDRMLGQQEVVVRPLEDPLVRVRGVTGSTDLGDGLPTLVLDLFALARTSTRTEAEA